MKGSVNGNVDIRRITRDDKWLAEQSLSEYAGEWIAVLNRKIIARGPSLEMVIKDVESMDLELLPFYVRVPEGAVIE